MANPTNPPASSSAPSTGPAATTTPTARTSTPVDPASTPESGTTTVSGSPVEADTPRGDIRTGSPAALPPMPESPEPSYERLSDLLDRTPGEPIDVAALDLPFTEDMLDEMREAGSPFYQMASSAARSLAELEIVAAQGNLTRVQAVVKELESYAQDWEQRPDAEDTADARRQPPMGRATRQGRQIRAGEPEPTGRRAPAASGSTTPAGAPSRTDTSEPAGAGTATAAQAGATSPQVPPPSLPAPASTSSTPTPPTPPPAGQTPGQTTSTTRQPPASGSK